jgi:hypothetical protein
MHNWILTKLVPVAAAALAEYLIKALRENPDVFDPVIDGVVDKLGHVLPTLVDKATDLTPWEWDDRLLDGMAQRISSRLVPGIVNQISKNLPFGLGR